MQYSICKLLVYYNRIHFQGDRDLAQRKMHLLFPRIALSLFLHFLFLHSTLLDAVYGKLPRNFKDVMPDVAFYRGKNQIQ